MFINIVYCDKTGVGNQVCTAKQIDQLQSHPSLNAIMSEPSQSSPLSVTHISRAGSLLRLPTSYIISTFHHSNLFNYSSGQELFDVQVINPSHP